MSNSLEKVFSREAHKNNNKVKGKVFVLYFLWNLRILNSCEMCIYYGMFLSFLCQSSVLTNVLNIKSL